MGRNSAGSKGVFWQHDVQCRRLDSGPSEAFVVLKAKRDPVTEGIEQIVLSFALSVADPEALDLLDWTASWRACQTAQLQGRATRSPAFRYSPVGRRLPSRTGSTATWSTARSIFPRMWQVPGKANNSASKSASQGAVAAAELVLPQTLPTRPPCDSLCPISV
jgi:hypothetical protein